MTAHNKIREKVYITVIVGLVAVCGVLYKSSWRPAHATQVYYSQDTQANQRVIELIQSSDRFVYFAIYTFTRTDIKEAMLGAKLRGMDVRGLVDRGQTEKNDLQRKIVDELRKNGISIVEQDHLGIMHLKTVVTDKAYASGSYNWTSAATNLNDEVLEISSDNAVRAQYERIIRKLLGKYAT